MPLIDNTPKPSPAAAAREQAQSNPQAPTSSPAPKETPAEGAPEPKPEKPLLFKGMQLERSKLAFWPKPETPAETPPETPETLAEGEQEPDAAGEKSRDEAPKDPPEDPRLKSALERIAQAEAKLREERTAFESERKKLSELADDAKTWAENPLEMLEKRGWDYERLTNYVVSGKKPDGAKGKPAGGEGKVLDELQRLQKDFDEMKKAQKDKEDRAAFDTFHQNVTKHVNEKGAGAYKYIHAYGEQDAVMHLITSHAKETGQVMDIEEAAKKIDELLKERHEKAAAALTPKPGGETVSPRSPQKPASRPQANGHPKTLTNAQASQVPSKAEPGSKGIQSESREQVLRDAARHIIYR